MRGRKPKPISRQIAEGDPRKKGKHKLEQALAAKPKPTGGLPKCPRHLKGRARAVWTFWSRELEVMNLDKRPDGPLLEGACVSYSRAVKADLILEKQGLTFEEKFINDAGEAITLKIRKHPAVEISNRSWIIVKTFCSEFGLSPLSRERLKPDVDDEPEDDLMAALSKPREPRATPSPSVN